jgi:hypothetical protein
MRWDRSAECTEAEGFCWDERFVKLGNGAEVEKCRTLRGGRDNN